MAKHAQKKGAKKSAHRRPKKKTPSQVNRKPTEYYLHTMEKPPAYTVIEE
jgi:hypothetical protein